MRRGFLVLSVLIVTWLSVVFPLRAGAGRVLPTPPNVVIIYTDDQQPDSLTRAWQPQTYGAIVQDGLQFTTGIVPNGPLCCPSRAGMLTGTYSHTNGVYGNHGHYGGFSSFHGDNSTIATWLHGAGYATGWFGKYLNGYGADTGGLYVPPGWDRWNALVDAGYDPDLGSPWSYSDDGQGVIQGTGYATDFFASDAASWIGSVPPAQPVLAIIAPYAPHNPTLPSPAHEGAFQGIAPYRPRSYNVASSSKPAYVAGLHRWDAARSAAVDAHRQAMLEVDLSLDDLTQTVVDALTASGRLSNTLLVYASDNGFMLGEHRLYGKSVPYSSSIRVPFAISAPFLGGPVNAKARAPVATIDLAPTAAAVAGVTPTLPDGTPANVDGISLVPILSGTATSVRSRVLIEHMNTGRVPGYCAARSVNRLFVRYQTGEEEAYNYVKDPFELKNVAYSRKAGGWVSRDRRWVKKHCSPLPPHFGDWGSRIPRWW